MEPGSTRCAPAVARCPVGERQRRYPTAMNIGCRRRRLPRATSPRTRQRACEGRRPQARAGHPTSIHLSRRHPATRARSHHRPSGSAEACRAIGGRRNKPPERDRRRAPHPPLLGCACRGAGSVASISGGRCDRCLKRRRQCRCARGCNVAGANSCVAPVLCVRRVPLRQVAGLAALPACAIGCPECRDQQQRGGSGPSWSAERTCTGARRLPRL